MVVRNVFVPGLGAERLILVGVCRVVSCRVYLGSMQNAGEQHTQSHRDTPGIFGQCVAVGSGAVGVRVLRVVWLRSGRNGVKIVFRSARACSHLILSKRFG